MWAVIIAAILTGPADEAPLPGAVDVVIDRTGVIVRAAEPGLVTVDGAQVEVGGDPRGTEWVGVTFVGPGGPHRGVASAAPDPLKRQPVRPVHLEGSRTSVTSVVDAAGIRVSTRFWWDRDGYLLAGVTLSNRTSDALRDVVYTREWRVGPGEGAAIGAVDRMTGVYPDDVLARAWWIGELEPDASFELGLSYRPPPPQALGGSPEVPLALWTDASWPGGLPLGVNYGISFGDYDADGHPDLFVLDSEELWRNVDGQTWQLAADLNPVLTFENFRYGSSFGDYDRDGLPDIGCEPRANIGWCFHLLKNLGSGPNFIDVAPDPNIVSFQPCGANTETICWGDVDGDGELDMFLPNYAQTGGNYFFHNQGPTGPSGEHQLVEKAVAVGVKNNGSTSRPEGTMLVDIDQDGDLDWYSNGLMYQNRSSPGAPQYKALLAGASGIVHPTILDEGAMLFDHDRDGDPDLVVAYIAPSIGVTLYENRGDGTFSIAPAGVVESPSIGLELGMSAEDWDLDGDIDFTTRQVFRRNQLAELGVEKFTVATHAINPFYLSSAMPAWGDFDGDGDLDSAIGNYQKPGTFHENTTLSPDDPLVARPYVRVRPVRDAPGVPRGLEVEYGAYAEVVVHDDPPELRRRKFTASSAGYLNQNEYDLTFGLGDVSSATVDARLDVRVEFPGATEQGIRRVDRHVNPLLGDLSLHELEDREIRVYRDGRVRAGGCDVPAAVADDPVLTTTGGGLVLPQGILGLADPAPSPTPDRWIGIELDMTASAQPVRVTEVMLDGQLDAPVACAEGTYNVAVFAVGGPAPTWVAGLARSTAPDNDRSFLPVDLVLQPGQRYRVIARVTSRRITAVSSPVVYPELTLNGGVDFQSAAACVAGSVDSAPLDTMFVHLAVRFRADDARWFDLGQASAWSQAVLSGDGEYASGSAVSFQLSGAPPASPIAFVLGERPICLPVLGGTLIPRPDLVVPGYITDAAGQLALSATLGTISSFAHLYAQVILADPSSPIGVSLTNAIAAP